MIICRTADRFEGIVNAAKEHSCKFLCSDETIESTLEGLRNGTIEEVEIFLSHTYFDIKKN